MRTYNTEKQLSTLRALMVYRFVATVTLVVVALAVNPTWTGWWIKFVLAVIAIDQIMGFMFSWKQYKRIKLL